MSAIRRRNATRSCRVMAFLGTELPPSPSTSRPEVIDEGAGEPDSSADNATPNSTVRDGGRATQTAQGSSKVSVKDEAANTPKRGREDDDSSSGSRAAKRARSSVKKTKSKAVAAPEDAPEGDADASDPQDEPVIPAKPRPAIVLGEEVSCLSSNQDILKYFKVNMKTDRAHCVFCNKEVALDSYASSRPRGGKAKRHLAACVLCPSELRRLLDEQAVREFHASKNRRRGPIWDKFRVVGYRRFSCKGCSSEIKGDAQCMRGHLARCKGRNGRKPAAAGAGRGVGSPKQRRSRAAKSSPSARSPAESPGTSPVRQARRSGLRASSYKSSFRQYYKEEGSGGDSSESDEEDRQPRRVGRAARSAQPRAAQPRAAQPGPATSGAVAAAGGWKLDLLAQASLLDMSRGHPPPPPHSRGPVMLMPYGSHPPPAHAAGPLAAHMPPPVTGPMSAPMAVPMSAPMAAQWGPLQHPAFTAFRGQPAAMPWMPQRYVQHSGEYGPPRAMAQQAGPEGRPQHHVASAALTQLATPAHPAGQESYIHHHSILRN